MFAENTIILKLNRQDDADQIVQDIAPVEKTFSPAIQFEVKSLST